MASTYLTRTQTAGNRRTFTWSAWVKRGIISTRQTLLSAGIDGSNESFLRFDASDYISIKESTGNSPSFALDTTPVFSDPSAWYHIVFAVDTTQSTASDRVKLYVNGSQITSFSSASYPSQNYETRWGNNSQATYIGQNVPAYQDIFDGYMSLVNFTDGYAYAASTFGSTSTNGQWVYNLNPSVTYGTNGYVLKFTNASDLGEDFSGNNNDFTKTGSGDKVLDNPANVFATWNTNIPMNSTMTMAKGNLEGKTGSNYASDASNTWFSTIGVSSGKWYAEFKMTQNSASYGSLVGVSYDIDTNQQGSTANAQNFCQHSSMTSGWGYSNDGTWMNGATNTGFATYTTNDIIGIALDLDNNKLYWSKNGTYQNSANPATGSNGISIDANKEYFFAISDTSLSNTFTFQANFGNPIYSIASGNADGNGEGNFEYAPPTNYLALCTKNISSALTLPIGKGSSYFNPVLYTGNGTSQTITGVGFQPDFIWLKNRQQSDWHNLVNSTVGATKRNATNSTSTENTNAQNVSAFASDGFSVGSDHNTNANGENYISWNWLSNGGTTASNSDGSITSTVQANTTSGFSIVTYTGTQANATVGHGLGVPPKMIICKCRTSDNNWPVYHASITADNYLRINTQNALDGAGIFWNDTDPTNTVFSIGASDESNKSGGSQIAYCFAEKEGYSRFGSYTGNGDQGDGVFIYTAFRPAFVMVKNTAEALTSWVMVDSARSSYNPAYNNLFADSSGAENTSDYMQGLHSNGFKWNSASSWVNKAGQKYIYMAFAENPFVDGSGVPVTAR